MSRTLLLSVIVASLSTIVGCGASSTRHSAAPATANVACDESWTPPGEMKMSFTGDSSRTNALAAPTERLKGSYRPNANDRPTRGAVHAATY